MYIIMYVCLFVYKYANIKEEGDASGSCTTSYN